jgi:hypothetical protein
LTFPKQLLLQLNQPKLFRRQQETASYDIFLGTGNPAGYNAIVRAVLAQSSQAMHA